MKQILLGLLLIISIAGYTQSISSISPTSAVVGQNLTVTITGSNTHFQSGSSTSVSFRYGQGSPTYIYPNYTSAQSNTLMTANFSIPQYAQAGNYDLVVYNPYDYYIYKYGCFNISGPSLVSISPSTANAGQQNLSVTITGRNTNFTQGSGCFLSIPFGTASATVHYSAPQNDTTLFAVISIPSNVYTGAYPIYYSNGQGLSLSLQNGLFINGIPRPEITAVTPASAYIGESLNVTITGTNCHFQQASTTSVYFYGPGSGTITVSNTYAADNNTLHAYINIGSSYYSNNAGWYNLNLYNSIDGQITKSNIFEVKSPTIASVLPNSGTNGQTLNVTITGDHTHFTPGSTTVFFGFNQASSSVNSVNVISATELVANVTIPANTQTGNYQVKVYNSTDGYIYAPSLFHVDGVPPPSILSVTPNSAIRGESLDVTITGSNCHFTQGSGTQVHFYSNGSSTIYPSSTYVIDDNNMHAYFNIPQYANTGYYDLKLYNSFDNWVYKSACFQVKNPYISNITPSTGNAGETLNVSITGAGTHFQQGSQCTVNFGFAQGSNVTINSNTNLTTTVTIPQSTYSGNYNLSVYNNYDGTVYYNGSFYVNGIVPPALSSVTPQYSYKGESLNVTITGSNCHFLQASGTQVYFYNNSSSTIYPSSIYSPDNNTVHAYLNIPTSVQSGLYNLKTYNQTDGWLYLNSCFEIKNASISGITPSTCNAGQNLNVTITGNHTHFLQASQSAVTFYFNQASQTYGNIISISDNNTMIVNVSVPSNIFTGNYQIKVYNNIDGNMYFNNFYVNGIAQPSIESISPNHGNQGETLNVTITGANTHFSSQSSTITFYSSSSGSITINSYNVISPTVINANISIAQFAQQEYLDLHVITGNEYAYKGNCFKIGGGIASMHPSTANPGETINITVNSFNCHFTYVNNAVYFVHYLTNEIVYPNSVSVVNDNSMIINVTMPSTKSVEKYYLVITNTYDGDMYLPDIFLTVGATDINEFGLTESVISLYPNPATESIQIASNDLPISKIEIFNTQSQKIQEQTFNNAETKLYTVNFENLNIKSGVYFIKVYCKDGSAIVKKIIVTR